MADREKVQKGLDLCSNALYCDDPNSRCDQCPYKTRDMTGTDEINCSDVLMSDALELLKAQDSIISVLKSDLDETLEVVAERSNVVRCKDCRWGDWSKNIKGEEMIFCYNGDTGIEDGYLHEPEWFCAEGIAKDTDVRNK